MNNIPPNVPLTYHSLCECGHIAGDHRDAGNLYKLYKGYGGCRVCKCSAFQNKEEKIMNDCPNFNSGTETCRTGFICKGKIVIKDNSCPYDSQDECPLFKKTCGTCVRGAEGTCEECAGDNYGHTTEISSASTACSNHKEVK